MFGIEWYFGVMYLVCVFGLAIGTGIGLRRRANLFSGPVLGKAQSQSGLKAVVEMGVAPLYYCGGP